MPQQVRGVLAHKKGDPVSVETIIVPDPGPGEAVVKVQAMLIDLYLQGRLPLDKFVTETVGLDDVEEAFYRIHKGEVLRSVVMLSAGWSTASGPPGRSPSTAAPGTSTKTCGSSATRTR